MIDMPRHAYLLHGREFHGVIGFQDGVETVELVRYTCREDGRVWIVVNRMWEVGVLRWFLDFDVA